MRKILIGIALLASSSAFAQHHHHHHHGQWRHHDRSWQWVGPALIGGIIAYEIGRNQAQAQQPQVIIQSPPVYVQQNCTPWFEVQNPDGTITRTRTCQ